MDSSSSALGIRVAASTADVARLVGGDPIRLGLPKNRLPLYAAQAHARQHPVHQTNSAVFKTLLRRAGASARLSLRESAARVTSSLITQVSGSLAPNRAFRDWGKIFDVDNTLATAMIDRLMHHGEAVVIQGDSYRLKDRPPE